MDGESVTVGETEAMSPEVSSTEVKKLKQARLPFSPLEEKKQKKRRTSIGDKNPKAAKIVCKESQNIDQIDLDNDIEIIEKEKIGNHDLSGDTKKEKENISKTNIKSSGPLNSPICRKYEADSSSLDNDSMVCDKNTKRVQESVKRRSKKVTNNSPSIASLFKKIANKKEANVVEVVQVSDDDEPQKKKIKVSSAVDQDECKISNSSLLDSSALAEESILRDSSSKDTSSSSSMLEKKSLPVTPSQNKSIIKTPKQVEKEKERRLKQEEREIARVEREKEKLDQKNQKEKERQIKKEEVQKNKDEKIKKKQDELDVKSKEKEDKRLKKEEELEEKRLKKEEELEEKRLKKEEEFEEKRLKKEEKQKKDQDKLKQEELKKLAEEEEVEKQQKLKQKFVQFFVTKKGDSSPSPQPVKDGKDSAGPFMKFRVKGNMKLAPLVRRDFSGDVKRSFDELFMKNKCKTNYLQELQQPNYKKRKSTRTLPVQEKVEDCEIIEEDIDVNNGLSEGECMKHTVRAKLLMFCENRRPAYYGTWSKQSSKVSGRRPLAKETHFFDYDYDSDDDWEEEEAGESLSDSEGEGEEEEDPAENNYEEDNVFFVPHGYLSDDEGHEEDDLEDSPDDAKEKDGETQKLLLKKKQEEFEIEMKQKMKPLKPKVYGCVWLHDVKSHQAYHQLVKIFANYKAVNILGGEYPIGTTVGGDNIPHDPKDVKSNEDDEENNSTTKFCKNFPETAVPDLIRLLHGNRHGKKFLCKEFTEHVKRHSDPEETTLTPFTPNREIIAKKRIEQKIQSLGQYVKAIDIGMNVKNRCWAVPLDIREQYNLADLPPENTWTYNLPPREFAPETPKEEDAEDTPKCKPNPSLITKFTKVLTDQEKAEKMKPVSTPSEKGDSKPELIADTKTPADVTRASGSAVGVKMTPKSTKSKAVVKNIAKFFAKAPPSKTVVDCIELE